MNLQESATLVAVIAAYDNRTSDETTDQVWQHALDDVPLPDAVEAVHAHFRESTAWLMPAEIRARVKAARRARLAAAGPPDIPPGLDQAAERRWAAAWRQAVGSGVDPGRATAMADRDHGIIRAAVSRRPVAALVAGARFGGAGPARECPVTPDGVAAEPSGTQLEGGNLANEI